MTIELDPGDIVILQRALAMFDKAAKEQMQQAKLSERPLDFDRAERDARRAARVTKKLKAQAVEFTCRAERNV